MSRKTIRCAIYTRKSSEEGLEQEFNSLDAQREACEAYVKSQAHEGWKLLPARYDDGGYSGGSMERPALKTLLADIEAGKVDTIVVYKIDRLTRSLPDFARMVELFDRQAVSFVSITQAFNTTTSMGRLTLNVLLSFAQFEREVTGERIRDKIAASKKKGMWMGGTVPLGYDPPEDDSRTLVVNTAEAETVRIIFRAYLEIGSVHALKDRLDARGIRSKQRITRKGKRIGGHPFGRGALFHLLRNPLYRGMITHKGKAYPGNHGPIVDEDLFDAVQCRLDTNAHAHLARKDDCSAAPLKGRLFDADGHSMSPAFARGANGRRYRYYVSAPLQQGQRAPRDGDTIRRVSAPAIEAKLREVARRLAPAEDDPIGCIGRATILARSIEIDLPAGKLGSVRERLAPGESAERHGGSVRITLPCRMQVRGGRSWVVGDTARQSRRDPVLIKALRRAHALVDWNGRGMPLLDAAPDSLYLRRLLRLAFLAPDLQRAILDGRQPPGLQLERLMQGEIPVRWDEQRAMFAAFG
ncbi:recombinase family protein [Parasphingopyxis marina]|uniref:Recombinase family protein n=1 Tax=Parasphingopyxis marina TaxID=2761622 RepID=A0A842HW04_9SPHN|nr:recombinase family protein [Parasphingopyxis marina]MBC2776607.1 recombinase family protein [Parasphingopyxis marina]